ncbi:MAG: ATP-binding cassette domain-containing protein, partial [Peptacetobacter hiranonis]|nr:ATP-binding cassette domain-containing protein [Peptacetobacter hiranonis]
MDNTILKVRNLKKYFKVDSKNTLKAVDNVSFDVYKNEILGVVGESGCGKTTLGRTILGLYKPTGGEIIFDGEDINKFNKNEMLEFKKRAQMIFQDPYASLNPRMTVKDIIAEGLEVQYPKMSNEEKENKV